MLAAGVALIAAVAGVWTSVYLGARGHRRALQAQFAGERTRALLRALHIIETHSQVMRDRIFNLTETRRDWEDPFTGEQGDPYGPHPRDIEDVARLTLAEAVALLAVFGSPTIEGAYQGWEAAIEKCENAFLQAEFNWHEGQTNSKPQDFAAAREEEKRSLTALENAIRQALLNQSYVKLPG